MNRLASFVIKEFKHIFRDKRTMLILFGIPVVQLLLFGYVITNEIKNASIAIYDKSNDATTRSLASTLSSTPFFVRTVDIRSDDEMHKVLRAGRAKMVVVFEPNFERNLINEHRADVQIVADASEPNIASSSVNYATSIITSAINQKFGQTKVPISVEPRMVYNEAQKNVFMFVPGTMALILMLVSAMMTSITIAREKETGTMEILLVSPLRPVQIIVGKVLPYFLLSFVNAVVIIFMSRFVFGLPMLGSYALIMGESMLFILLALSAGIFISTVSKSQQQAMFISMFGLLMPTMLLSGFIYAIEGMPTWLQVICNLMPPRWFVVILKDVMLKGSTFAGVWRETLILVAMTVFFIALSVKKFKVRLE